MSEPLHFVPVEKWGEIKKILILDFPRSLSGYTFLENMEYIIKRGLDYGVKVYCPFGDINNGIIVLNIKKSLYEIIIHCPRDDTKYIEEALKNTKLIHWTKMMTVPFAPKHVMDCVISILNERQYKIDHISITETFILLKDACSYNISLSSEFSFKLLTLEYIELVNETWPHKYPSSEWYFELLINADLGYGLFKEHELVAWVFVQETGALGHLYTLENHRRKGYGELILKLISNMLLKKKQYVIAFCVQGNSNAYHLYKKLGFKRDQDVYWCYFENNYTHNTQKQKVHTRDICGNSGIEREYKHYR